MKEQCHFPQGAVSLSSYGYSNKISTGMRDQHILALMTVMIYMHIEKLSQTDSALYINVSPFYWSFVKM